MGYFRSQGQPTKTFETGLYAGPYAYVYSEANRIVTFKAQATGASARSARGGGSSAEGAHRG